MPQVAPFSPTRWASRFKANAGEAERNSLMDSGWSKAVADRCEQITLDLFRELIAELREIPVDPTLLFDYPRLAAVLAAVHESQ